MAANEPAAVWVPLDELRPWERNPRKNDPAVAEVAESIREFGFGAPIVARKADGMIIAGHTRYKAARLLELARVPVRYLDLSEADARRLALADNRLGEIAEWDDEQLLRELSALKAEDGLTATGFEDADLDRLTKKLGDEHLGKPAGDEPGEATITCPACAHEFTAPAEITIRKKNAPAPKKKPPTPLAQA